jgi:putative ABC transport system permease protein
VLIRSLPYGDASRLVYVWSPNSNFKPPIPKEIEAGNADFYDWQSMSRSFTRMAGFTMVNLDSGTGDNVDRINALKVTGNFFETLAVAPWMGRAIDGGDDQPGHERVAVISHVFWQSKFAGSPGVLIGVMPPGFDFPRHGEVPYDKVQVTRVWIPVAFTPEQRAARESGDNKIIARLAPGVSAKQAQQEMTAIAAQTDRLHQEQDRGWRAYVAPLTETVVGPVRLAMLLLLGASPGRVLGMILRRGLWMTLAGIAVGVTGAFAVTRFLASWLYGVSADDPLTFITAPLLLHSSRRRPV